MQLVGGRRKSLGGRHGGRAKRAGSARAGFLCFALGTVLSCYSAGEGSLPPAKNFYFPVGLAVSRGGNVLYAVNSDFDLQWNGGTLQTYDLDLIRKHAVLAIQNPNDPRLPLLRPPSPDGPPPACPSNPPLYKQDGSGTRQPLGETCAPPVDSTVYVRDSAIIGAFATDLQLSPGGSRLYVPVRGDASLTWADVVPDDPNAPPPEDPATLYAPFGVDCGRRIDNRCDAAHHAGNNADEPGNTRHITMPGEPFGMAQTEDGAAILITHLTDTKASLLSTGVAFTNGSETRTGPPALQFVLDGLPSGGNGVAVIPHDPAAFGCASSTSPCMAVLPRPAFIETNRSLAELDLLRYYSDEGDGTQSSLLRPFLIRETTFTLTANASGTDSRGIAIDTTPRIACRLRVAGPDASANPPRAQVDVDTDIAACAQLPARVFIANRSPPSLIVGEVGGPSANGNGGFDADRLTIFDSVPLALGPSKVYLAPIVDQNGNFALRVFIVCFDSATIYVLDPDARALTNVLRVGAGPFAMATDPFSFEDVALRRPVPPDVRAPGTDLKTYRFAYVASFTNSYVQVLDLDDSRADKSTFGTIVYTLGSPTKPKGSQ